MMRNARESARPSAAMAPRPVSSLARRTRSSFNLSCLSPGRGDAGEGVTPAGLQRSSDGDLTAGRRHEDAVAVVQSESSCCICPSTFEVLNSAWAAASKSLVTFPGSASSLVAQLIELTLVLVLVTYEYEELKAGLSVRP